MYTNSYLFAEKQEHRRYGITKVKDLLQTIHQSLEQKKITTSMIILYIFFSLLCLFRMLKKNSLFNKVVNCFSTKGILFQCTLWKRL